MSSPLRAVLENPHDNQARLVCADWLDDKGQHGRAEFIRQHIKLYSLSKKNTLYKELADSCEALFFHHWRDITGHGRVYGEEVSLASGLTCLASVGWVSGSRYKTTGLSFTIRRGFVCGIEISAAMFLLGAKELFTEQPIEEVKIYDKNVVNELEDERRPGEEEFRRTGPVWVIWADEHWHYSHFWPAVLVPSDYAPSSGHVLYPSEDAATSFLQGRCILYGRNLVELPPMPQQPVMQAMTTSPK